MPNVYTCTMNLAIDLFIETDQLVPKVVNRTLDDDVQANGKGVNVSLVLKMLGIESTALGFRGGFTGKYIDEYLNAKEIQTDFVEVDGITRINVFTQVNSEKQEYKLVNQGPVISKKATADLIQKVKKIQAGDYLCVSGSLPRGVSPKILVEISKICQERDIFLILDTSYAEVLDCLKYHPYLLKPNEEEIATWFGKKKLTKEECIVYAKELISRGAKNVLLSLGGLGGVFLSEEVCIEGNSPKGKVVNTACAGDTLLGTFVGGILKNKEPSSNLQQSLAAGSSTAFRKGLTDFSDVRELMKQIRMKNREKVK